MTILIARGTKSVATNKPNALGSSKATSTSTTATDRSSHASAGSRRLHLLIRPFGQEYRDLSKHAKTVHSSIATSKGKAPVLARERTSAASTSLVSPGAHSEDPYNKVIARWRNDHTPGVRTTGVQLAKWQRIMKFDQVWRQKGLGLHLAPETLADQVLAMRADGVNRNTAGLMTSEIVQAKQDPAYEARYHDRLHKINYHYHKEATPYNKDPVLSKLDDGKKMKMILEGTFESANKQQQSEKRKTFTFRNDSEVVKPTEGPLSLDKNVNAGIEKVGAHIKKHLDRQGHDFYKMPLKQLEEKTRGLGIPGMHPMHFTKNLFQYVQGRRGVNKVDMAKFKRVRRTVIDRDRKRKMRGYRGQADT